MHVCECFFDLFCKWFSQVSQLFCCFYALHSVTLVIEQILRLCHAPAQCVHCSSDARAMGVRGTWSCTHLESWVWGSGMMEERFISPLLPWLSPQILSWRVDISFFFKSVCSECLPGSKFNLLFNWFSYLRNPRWLHANSGWKVNCNKRVKQKALHGPATAGTVACKSLYYYRERRRDSKLPQGVRV